MSRGIAEVLAEVLVTGLVIGLAAVSVATCSTPAETSDATIEPHPFDIHAVPADLTLPPVSDGTPSPGKRTRMTAREYRGTAVHHLLYLPTDWVAGSRYPVIVEYAGNGPYQNGYGDISTGFVDGSHLGYGISGGAGFLWICLPYVSADGTKNERRWWGDLGRTVAYCKLVVPRICAEFGGDPRAVFLAGFSRGAIACHFIGLHDDEIAPLWCGLICHSHFDGVRPWGYAGSDRKSAGVRLARLGARPQWISHETTAGDTIEGTAVDPIEATRSYLAQAAPRGRFTIRALPFRNHTDVWVLRDIPLRRELRAWVRRALPPR